MANSFEDLLAESEDVPAPADIGDTSFEDLLRGSEQAESDSLFQFAKEGEETVGAGNLPADFLDFGDTRPATNFQELVNESEDKGGFFTDAVATAKDFTLGFVEGGIQQIASEAQDVIDPKRLEGPQPETFAGQVGAGLGQVTVQAGTIAGATAAGAAAGAAVGSIVPVIGTAIGTGVGAGVGFAAGNLFTFIQGFRTELNEVEESVRAQSTATGEELEQQVLDAREKAAPTILVGEALDNVLAVTTAGTGGLLRGLGKGASKAAATTEATRQIGRLGMISNVLKSGAVEGIGEGIQTAGSSAAVESVLEGTDFLPEFGEALTEKETIRAAGVGFFTGGIARGVAQQNANFKEGTAVLEELSKAESTGEQASQHAQNVLEINQKLADIESPDTETQEVTISNTVATSQQLSVIAEEDGSFTLLPTEDGAFSILQGKADRLRELQETADVLRETGEFGQLAKQERKLERRIGARLESIRDFELAPVKQVTLLEEADNQLRRFAELDKQIQELEQNADSPERLPDNFQQLEKDRQEALELAEEALNIYDIDFPTNKELRIINRRKEATRPSEIEGEAEEAFSRASERAETIERKTAPAKRRKQVQQLSSQRAKAEKLTDRLLNEVDFLEALEIDTEIENDLKRAGLTSTELARVRKEMDEIRQRTGAEKLTKSQITDTLAETEALEDLFRDIDNDTLRALGLRRKGKVRLENRETGADFRVFAVEDTPEFSMVEFQEVKNVTDIADITDVSAQDTRPVEQLSSTENKRNTNPLRAIGAFFEARKERNRQARALFDARVEAENLKSSIQQTAVINAKLLNRAVNRVIGAQRFFSPGKALQQKVALLDKANRVLSGEAGLDTLPAEMHSVMQEIRGHIDELSLTLIDEGIVEGDIVQKIEAGVGTYLNRSYKVFTDPNWSKNVPQEIKNNAIGYLRRQMPKLTDQEIQNELALLLAKGQHPLSYIVAKKDDSSFRKILKKRKDIPEEIRALWGERTSAIENYAQTVLNMSSLIGTNKYLEEVKAEALGDFMFLDAKEGFDTPIKANPTFGGQGLVGPNGETLFTSPEIAEELNKIYAPNTQPLWARVAYGLVAGGKFSATVPTIITQTRNFWANPWFLVANGNAFELLNTSSLKDAARTAYGNVLPTTIFDPNNPNGTISKQQLEKYVRLGIIGEDVLTRELTAVRDDILNTEGTLQNFIGRQTDSNTKIAANMLKSGATSAIEVSTALYRGSDAFFKVVSFHKELDKYRQAFPNLTETQLEEIAADVVRNTLPTYSLAPETIQQLRRVPFIAPFAIFQAEVVRTQYNTVQLIKKELADPRTRGIGQKRAAGLILAHGSLLSTAELFRQLSGVSGEEEEDLRTVAAPWHQNKTLAMLPSEENGKVRRFVNLSFSSPFGVIQDPLKTFGRAETIQEALAAAIPEFLEPFISEDIMTRRALDIARNKIEGSTKTVYSIDDTPVEIARKSFLHAMGGLVPGAFKSIARFNRPDANFEQELFAELSGFKVVEQNIIDTAKFRTFNFKDRISAATSEASSVFAKKDPITDTQIREAFEELKRKRSNAFSDIRKEYLAMIRLSRDKQAIINSMQEAGAGKNNLLFIERNAVPQYEFSSALIDRIEDVPGRMEQISRALGEDFVGLIKPKKSRRSFKLQ